MDALSYALATDLESQGVEIYVVRFANPAGDGNAAAPCVVADVGSGSGDRAAMKRPIGTYLAALPPRPQRPTTTTSTRQRQKTCRPYSLKSPAPLPRALGSCPSPTEEGAMSDANFSPDRREEV